MDLFELVGKITIENSNANKALDETSEKGEQTQSKLGKAFSTAGKGAVAVGKVVGAGMVAAGTAIAGVTMKALSASGELEQNMGGCEQVFKQYAGSMQETAKNAFGNMGLSTSDFLATANKMGALYQGAGFSIEESSELASNAMQRAADVASIMGIDTSSAMEAIAGAAKGNFTMMDNLGVAMNDTTLQAYALEKGISKSTREMTNQEKIGLAMEMFMEKTAYAAGNYAKENGTLAGSLGTAKAALTNFLDGSGDVDQLVDSFLGAANSIVKNLKTLAPKLVSGITDLVNKVAPMLPSLLQELLPVIIEGAVGLIDGLVAVLPEILTTLMNSLPALIEGVQQIINALIQALPQIIESLVATLPTLIPMLVDALVAMIVMLCTMLPEIIQPIIDYLPEIIIVLVDALLSNLPALIMGCVQLISGLVIAMPQILSGLWEALKGVFNSLLTHMGEWFQPITDWFKSVWEGFIGVVSKVWDSIKNAVSIGVKLIASVLDAAFQIITLPFRFIWENCKEYIVAAWDWMKEKITIAINAIKDIITKVFTAVKDFITPIWDGIKNIIGNVWDKIKSGVSTAVNAVKDTVSSVFNGVKNIISNIFNNIKNTATSVWNGIMKAIKTPIEKARDLVKNAIDAIKGFFNFNFEWPKIKLPHFGITPSGWSVGDLLDGVIPKLGIEWYAKGGVMKQPTLFDYNPTTGTARVGGEAGDEAVAPISTLQQYIKSAVRDENNGVVQKLERIITLLVQFFPEILDALDINLYLDTGTLVSETAPAMDAELGRIAIKKGRGR